MDVLANAIGYFRHDDGAGRLAAPVWLGAVIGTSIWEILAWLDRPSVLRSTAWPVFVLGLGWVLVGMVPVLVTGYQPNRYVVPALPGLSLIIGSAVSIGLERWRGSAASRRDPWLTPVALVVLLVAIVGPGIGRRSIEPRGRRTTPSTDRRGLRHPRSRRPGRGQLRTAVRDDHAGDDPPGDRQSLAEQR